MQKTLVDSGPLVALFDRDDQYHWMAVSFFEDFKNPMVTSWPVLTEVSHLLDFDVRAQVAFLGWIEKHPIEIADLSELDLKQIIEYMNKYQDCPMDLADASLVILAEKMETTSIITLDKDFTIYRLPPRKTFRNLLSL